MSRPLWRIRDRATFVALRSAPRVRQASLSLTYAPMSAAVDEPPRVAFAIGRKVGNAVTRNRLRRRLREVASSLELPPGAYLIGAGADATALPFSELRSTLASLADRVLAQPAEARRGLAEVTS